MNLHCIGQWIRFHDYFPSLLMVGSMTVMISSFCSLRYLSAAVMPFAPDGFVAWALPFFDLRLLFTSMRLAATIAATINSIVFSSIHQTNFHSILPLRCTNVNLSFFVDRRPAFAHGCFEQPTA